MAASGDGNKGGRPRGLIWDYFHEGAIANPTTKRRSAKCTRCQTSYKEGRTEVMAQHIQVCGGYTHEERMEVASKLAANTPAERKAIVAAKAAAVAAEAAAAAVVARAAGMVSPPTKRPAKKRANDAAAPPAAFDGAGGAAATG
ncbi:unnamed protein product, partial [Phaeothamnion confervicola]